MYKRGLPGFFERIFSKTIPFSNAHAEIAILKINDVMTNNVMCVHREDKLIDAAHTMIGSHISCLVVLDNDYKPGGIITERDFIMKLGMTEKSSASLLVLDLMTKKLVTAPPHTDLFEAQKTMKLHNFRKIVVVQNDELKGIVTQTDLCKVIAGLRTPMINAPLVGDVMTRKVLMVSCDDEFLKAKKLMAAKDMGSVLVMEKNDICGIFTEFDIVSEFFMNPNKLKNSRMHDLVSKPIICISPDFDLVFVNKLMLEHNFRRLPVIENDRLVGIITQTDVARGMYEFIEKSKDVKNDRKAKYQEPEYEIVRKANIMLYKKKLPVKG
ncbi:MAG: CBS domain-containing protein [archaeon]